MYKSIRIILISAVTIILMTGCTRSTVDAGVEGVMVYKPYFLGHGGVDEDPIKTGATWTALSTQVARYNIKPEIAKEHFQDLTASDNVAIDFDVYLTLKIQNGKSPIIHEHSGRDWYVNKVRDTFRGYVRNEARSKSSIDLRTNQEAILDMQVNIKSKMLAYFKDIELPVDVVKVNVGKVVPPAEVLAEAAQTAAQKQRKQTQEQRKLAEDARADAERSAALADKAYSDKFSMTTEQFLRNKELDIMARAVDSGGVSLIMNASSAQPMFKVDTPRG